MVSASESPCLWIITDRSIFGFSIQKLMRLGKGSHNIDWKSLPTLPSCSDFYLNNLPQFALHPLLYDSNIFLSSQSATNIYQLFFQNDQLLQVSEAPPTSIPPLPTNEFQCPYFANIGGKVYLLAYDSWKDMREEPVAEGFWVLDPAIGQWEALEYPIPIGDMSFQGAPFFFALHGKLFLKLKHLPQRQYYLFCFDCQNREWHQVDNIWKNDLEISGISLALPYPDPADRAVGLTCRVGFDGPSQPRVKVCALLLDGKDNSILCLQQLDELYVGIEPPFLLGLTQVAKFVDLGNGMVCALVSGNKSFRKRTVLWVLVFSLSWSAQEFELEANDDTDAPCGERRGKFLDVELHVNRLYYLPHDFMEDPKHGTRDMLQSAFFTHHPFHKDHDEGGAKKTYSPYDLNASDNPENIITQVQLRGENYDEWARAIEISLRARRKWGFIDGTHIQPKDDAPELEDWWTVQSMIVSWILNTIEPSLRSTVAYAETAQNLWEDIKERFSVVNGPRIQQIKSDLSRCKQEGMMMATYFGKLKILWDELANNEKIPSCTCGGCKCGIGAQLEKRREEEKVHQLLMGLDDTSYGIVRSNILASDPLPSLSRVYAMLVQEERVRMMAKSTEN